MLVCNVSLRPPHRAIAAGLAEAATAADATATGNVVFATLVDDPASVGDFVDAYSGEIMLEAASAADTLNASIPAVFAADVIETATAVDAPSWSAAFTPAALTGLIGWWDASVTASITLSGSDILSVADQSGVGNTMSWDNGKPTYNATGFNSSYPAFMIGTPFASSLRAAIFPLGTALDTLTIWAVCSLGASGTQAHGRMLSYGNPRDYDNVGAFFLASPSSTSVELWRNSTVASGAATAHPALHRIIATVQNSGANAIKTVYVDGVSVGTHTVFGGNWATGGQLTIGRSTASSDGNLITPMAECGVATSYSDATKVGQLDTYLKTKWGL